MPESEGDQRGKASTETEPRGLCEASQTPRWRRWTCLAIGLLISGVLFFIVLRRVPLTQILDDLASAEAWPLILALVVQLAGLGAMAWRLRALLRFAGGASFRDCFHGQLLGFAVNCIVPFRLGELAKVDSVGRRSEISRVSVLAAVGTERLLDLLCLFAMLALAAPLVLSRFDLRWVAVLAGAALLAAFVAWWSAVRPASLRDLTAWMAEVTGFAFLSRFAGAAKSFADGLSGLRSGWVVLESLLASVVYWCCAFITISLWMRAFSLQAPWFAAAVVLLFLAFSTAIPASPGYVGTYDYFFLSALGVFGIDAAEGGSMVLVGHFLGVVPMTLVGIALASDDMRDVARRFRESMVRRERDADSA